MANIASEKLAQRVREMAQRRIVNELESKSREQDRKIFETGRGGVLIARWKRRGNTFDRLSLVKHRGNYSGERLYRFLKAWLVLGGWVCSCMKEGLISKRL